MEERAVRGGGEYEGCGGALWGKEETTQRVIVERELYSYHLTMAPIAYYEDKDNFTPVFQTAISLIQTRGDDDICKLIQQAEVSVENTDYDNWNGGTYGYTVYVNLSVKEYANLSKAEIKNAEKTISESLNEVTKGDNNNYFNVQISPKFMRSDINWDLVGGQTGKEQMKRDLEAIRDILISVSTGGPRIQEVESKYKTLHSALSKKCKLLNIVNNNSFDSLWGWYGRYSNELPTYQSRRVFIQNLLAPTFEAFNSDNASSSVASPIVELDDWDRIKRTVIKIKQDSSSAKNEEDFQQIGLLCREVIISLAQNVYNPEIHSAVDDNGIEIGKTDAVKMIGNYIKVRLAGSSNEELKAYAKATNKLANLLTHKRDAKKQDMLLSVSATMALINFIGILEEKI